MDGAVQIVVRGQPCGIGAHAEHQRECQGVGCRRDPGNKASAFPAHRYRRCQQGIGKNGQRKHQNPPEVPHDQRQNHIGKVRGNALRAAQQGAKAHEGNVGVGDKILHDIQHRHQCHDPGRYPFSPLFPSEKAEDQAEDTAKAQAKANNGQIPRNLEAAGRPEVQQTLAPEHRHNGKQPPGNGALP